MASEYTEHTRIDSGACQLIDASGHFGDVPDAYVWVGIFGDGKWMTPEEAEAFAADLIKIVAAHRARKGKTQ